ncbi:VWA domain-containing protein [Candidatus Woesearchaeota archaeon]|nr:VWA domain-containing protein [Candidatus Woesearchaeota archaeon]
MAELVFTNPNYLWLLLSIPLLIATHFFILKNLKTKAWKFANFEAIRRVTGATPNIKNTFVLSRNIFLLVIKLVILTVLIFSVADPILWYYGKSTSNNFVLAIDSSSSMLADDFQPNRFVAAKAAAVDFLNNIAVATKVGVVSFAGTSFAELSLTQNIGDAKQRISKLDIQRIGGTDLGEALITSVNVLLPEEKSRTIVLLTDGRSNVGTAVEKGIAYAVENRVIVHTIGIGTEQGGRFLKIDILSKLDEETLREIAEKTGGNYYKATSEEELQKAYDEIATLTMEKLSLRLQFPLLLLALALIFTEWGLVNTKYRTLP